MLLARVVPFFHEVKDRQPRLRFRLEPLALYKFTFGRREEALAEDVVVAKRARWRAQTGLFAGHIKGDRHVLATRIGVMDESQFWGALPGDLLPEN